MQVRRNDRNNRAKELLDCSYIPGAAGGAPNKPPVGAAAMLILFIYSC